MYRAYATVVRRFMLLLVLLVLFHLGRARALLANQGIGVFGAEYLAGRLMGLDPLQTVIPWTLGEKIKIARKPITSFGQP